MLHEIHDLVAFLILDIFIWLYG